MKVIIEGFFYKKKTKNKSIFKNIWVMASNRSLSVASHRE